MKATRSTEFCAQCHHCFDGVSFDTEAEREWWTEGHCAADFSCEVTYSEVEGR